MGGNKSQKSEGTSSVKAQKWGRAWDDGGVAGEMSGDDLGS